jgi:hypothetical protein
MPVYDRSYRRWDGTLQRRAVRWLPIAAAGIRLALRPKGTPLRTLFFYGFLFASLLPFLVLLILNYFLYSPPAFLAEEFVEALDRISVLRRAQYAALVHLYLPRTLLVLAVVIFGSGLVANDRASDALPLYLSRPLTLRDYIFGKFCVLGFFLSCLTLFPCLILWLFDLLVGASQRSAVLAQFSGIVVLCGSVILMYSSTMLGVSALCRRAMVAGVIWFGWNLVSALLALTLYRLLDQGEVLAISPVHALVAVADQALELEQLADEFGGQAALALLGLPTPLPGAYAWLSILGYSGLGLLMMLRSLRSADVTEGGRR